MENNWLNLRQNGSTRYASRIYLEQVFVHDHARDTQTFSHSSAYNSTNFGQITINVSRPKWRCGVAFNGRVYSNETAKGDKERPRKEAEESKVKLAYGFSS